MRIYLPKAYKKGQAYDVLYILDAADNEDMATPIANMATERNLVPPLIVVCISNRWLSDVRISSRERDFEPTKAEGFPISGGAGDFIGFLKDEMLPYVEKKYAGSGKKLLYGHSLSGLFAIYTMLTQSSVFDFYMASDPSLWWDDCYINKLAVKRLAGMANEKRYLYLAGRAGEMYATQGLLQMENILKQKAPKTLKWESKPYENEHHGSVTINTLYDGLKYYYFGYLPWLLDYYPMNGILLPGKPVNIMTYFTFLGYQPGVRYTTDGSKPVSSSPKLDWGITVNPGVTLKIKLFSTTGEYDREVKGSFVKGVLFKSQPRPANVKQGGLRFKYYEGVNDSVPAKTGIADSNFNMLPFPDTAIFSCKYEGYLQIPKTGYYIFVLYTGQMSDLIIDNQLLMHCQDSLQSFVLPLESGFHSIKVDYRHVKGVPGLDLTFVPAAIPGDGGIYKIPINIPRKLLYSNQD